MKDVRIWFKKFNEAIYISHLDLNRTMTHAINASGLKLWYTQGFNPHPFITFALPLSLGIAGLREAMDVRLVEEIENEKIVKSLNEFLPESIRIFDVSIPQMKPKDIFMARFKILFDGDIKSKLTDFFSRENILVQKKTKSGCKEIDLKKQILSYNVSTSIDKTILSIDLPAGTTKNINPLLITQKFSQDFLCDNFFEIIRIGLFDHQLNEFK